MSCICSKCKEEIKPFVKVLVEVESHEFGKKGDSKKVYLKGTHTAADWLILCDCGTGKSNTPARVQAAPHETSTAYVRGFSVICKKCRTTGGYDSKLEHKTYALGIRGNRLDPEYMTLCNGSFSEAPDCAESDSSSDDSDDSSEDSGSISSISSNEASDDEVVIAGNGSGVKTNGHKTNGSKANGPNGPMKASASESASVRSKASKASSKSSGSKRTVLEMAETAEHGPDHGSPQGSPQRKCRKVECPGAPQKPALGSKVVTAEMAKKMERRAMLLALLADLDE
jgi:hypothetical protein